VTLKEMPRTPAARAALIIMLLPFLAGIKVRNVSICSGPVSPVVLLLIKLPLLLWLAGA
jgi:hypothetical protein